SSMTVIRKSNRHGKTLHQIGDRQKIHLLRGCRIGARAAQQRYLRRPCVPRGFDGFFNFIRCGHAGRKDEWLPGASHLFYQRNIHQLGRRDLVRRNSNGLQELDRAGVKGAGKKLNTDLVGDSFQPGLPFPRRIRLAVEIVKSAAVPQRTASDSEALAARINGDCVRSVGLQLHRVRTGLFGSVHDAHSFIKALPVIGGQLRDDVDRLPGADQSVSDLYLWFKSHAVLAYAAYSPVMNLPDPRTISALAGPTLNKRSITLRFGINDPLCGYTG